jgi:hypothetical protein
MITNKNIIYVNLKTKQVPAKMKIIYISVSLTCYQNGWKTEMEDFLQFDSQWNLFILINISLCLDVHLILHKFKYSFSVWSIWNYSHPHPWYVHDISLIAPLYFTRPDLKNAPLSLSLSLSLSTDLIDWYYIMLVQSVWIKTYHVLLICWWAIFKIVDL